MTMSNEEILRSFRNAAKPSQQVKILAELNETSEEKIKEILLKQGVDPRSLPRKQREREKAAPQKAMAQVTPSILDVLKQEEENLLARNKEIETIIPLLHDEQKRIGEKLEAVQNARAELAAVYETTK